MKEKDVMLLIATVIAVIISILNNRQADRNRENRRYSLLQVYLDQYERGKHDGAQKRMMIKGEKGT